MRRSVALTGSYLTTHLGYFALLPVLPLVIQGEYSQGALASVGVALLLFTLSARSASILVSGYLERFPAKWSMVGALSLPATAFSAAALTPPFPGLVALLITAGVGISVNGLVSRAYIATTLSDEGGRLRVFTAINVAVNVSASAGPVVGTFIHTSGLSALLWLFVGGCYVVAIAAVVLLLPAVPANRDAVRPLSERLRVVAAMIRSTYGRRLALVSGVGWFVYAQLFSALPLFLAEVVDERLIAGYFSANAILVIAAQAPVSMLVGRLLNRGVGILTLLRIGCLIMSLAFVVIASVSWSPWLLFAGIAVFSLGEVVFVPLVDTAFANASTTSAFEAYNARQVATAIGESLGSFAGAAGYLALLTVLGPSGHPAVVGAAGSLAALVMIALARVGGAARGDRPPNGTDPARTRERNTVSE